MIIPSKGSIPLWGIVVWWLWHLLHNPWCQGTWEQIPVEYETLFVYLYVLWKYFNKKRALIGDSIPLVVFFSGMIQHVEITYSEEDPYKRLSYSGQQLNGMNNGKGLLTWKNGAAYEGEWQLWSYLVRVCLVCLTRLARELQIWPRKNEPNNLSVCASV